MNAHDVKTIKMISVCDTIHDFGKGKTNIVNNIFYKHFLNQNAKGYDENKLLEKLGIPNIKSPHDAIKYNEIDRNNITKLASNQNQNEDFYFTIKTYNVWDYEFTEFLSAICNAMNNHKLEFIADASVLKYEVICNLQTSPVIIISEAIAYDRLVEKKSLCMNNEISIIPDALRKDNGNLFGLESLSIADGRVMKYEYIMNGVKVLKQFDITTYIRGQNLALTETNNQLKPFIMRVIKEMQDTKEIVYKKHKKNDDRDDDESRSHKKSKLKYVQPYYLRNLLELIKQIYHLDYKEFRFYSEDNDGNPSIKYNDASQLFVSILFDFKRAGDQLQVASARKQKAIFVSGDRLAIAYAYIMNVPCIKPTGFYEDDENSKHDNNASRHNGKEKKHDKDPRKVLTFYNISPHRVIDAIQNSVYFHKKTGNSLYKIECYARYILYLKERLENSFPKGQQYIVKNKIIQTIQKSLSILKLIPSDIKIQRVSQRNKANELYDYVFLHRYNVIIHLLLLNIINDIIDETNMNKQYTYFKKIYDEINVAKQQDIDDVKQEDIDNAKQDMEKLYKEITDSYIYKYVDILNFTNDVQYEDDKDVNRVYFRDLLNYYILNIEDIKYLYDKHNSQYNIYSMISEYVNFDEYLNVFISQYPLIQPDTQFNKFYSTITTDMMEKYNSVIKTLIMNDKITIYCLQNYMSLKNHVPNITKQEVYISCKYKYQDNFKEYMQNLIKTSQLQDNKMNLELNKFDTTIGNLYEVHSKTSKIIRNIDEDMRDCKEQLDLLYDMSGISLKKKSFVDNYLLTRNKPPSTHELVQLGGSNYEMSDFDLFLDELDNIYNDNDTNTDDFAKIIMAFMVKQSCVFDRNGKLNTLYLESPQNPVSFKESSKQSTASSVSATSKLSAASTMSAASTSSYVSQNHKKL
jgi:hypothetical protein